MNNAQQIWIFLKNKGASDAGAAGALGNMEAESGLKSDILQYTGQRALGITSAQYIQGVDAGAYTAFESDGFGFGVCQWTSSGRKAKLKEEAKSRGTSIGNLDTQLERLWAELGESYPKTLTTLLTATSVKEASDVFMTDFERPGDQSDTTKEKRAALGQVYYNEYKEGTAMSNSSLISKIIQSPNKSARTGTISKIAIHCMAGNMSAQNCGSFFAKSTTKASSHYGIGSDGDICLYVDERERAWCTGGTKTFNGKTGSEIDQEAVTIEVANTVASEPWPVSDVAYAKLLDLVEDIARRNGLTAVTYKTDGSGTLQAHRWYAAKACPGDYLMNRFPEIATTVTARLQGQLNASTPCVAGGVACSGLTVGSKVAVVKAETYDGKAFRLYYDTYDVLRVEGDRVVIGIEGTVTAAVNVANLCRVG